MLSKMIWLRGAVKETHSTQFLSASTLAAALPHEASVMLGFAVWLVFTFASTAIP